jgi:dTDP-4-amino-4,6-dideoxy-D-glucose acyltransferase
MVNSFYSEEELVQLGLKKYGNNVLISRTVRIYNPENISLGNNVRIDDFCIISASGNINIGNFIHIGCYSSLIGKGDIILEDFVSISGRVSIYSSTDDYLGFAMTNPMIPDKYRKVITGNIFIKKHAIIGVGSVIMPDLIISEGCAISALTLVNKSFPSYTICRGIPAVIVGKRIKKIITNYEKSFQSKKM